jgi:hypothetical protein
MKKIMMSFFFVVTPLVAFAVGGTPAPKNDLQIYKNEELRYTVSVPASWIQRDQKIPGNSSVIEFISPKHEGSLLVMPAQESGGCKETLKKLETERKLTNVLPANQRNIPPEELKNAHAQEGVRAQYDFPTTEKVQAVQQNAWCLRKGVEKRILLGTFQKRNSPELFEAIFKSFAFLDKK